MEQFKYCNGQWAAKLKQGDQKIRKKIHQIIQRIAQKVALSKKAKISATKLNLKVQNIYIKQLLKP
jgi:hypothetical protein